MQSPLNLFCNIPTAYPLTGVRITVSTTNPTPDCQIEYNTSSGICELTLCSLIFNRLNQRLTTMIEPSMTTVVLYLMVESSVPVMLLKRKNVAVSQT
ncbi:hypothetical protein C0J52_03656 [Blattella germanica]|nr:hypothetical protein C0J52_03656 [Blattella germanica]